MPRYEFKLLKFKHALPQFKFQLRKFEFWQSIACSKSFSGRRSAVECIEFYAPCFFKFSQAFVAVPLILQVKNFSSDKLGTHFSLSNQNPNLFFPLILFCGSPFLSHFPLLHFCTVKINKYLHFFYKEPIPEYQIVH